MGTTRRNAVAKLLILPAVIWLIVFTIFPLIYSLRLSFFQVRLGRSWSFAGLANYAEVLTDARFWNAILFTTGFVVLSVGIQFIAGLALALLLSALGGFTKWLRTLWILPIFSTPIATAYLAITFFNEEIGPINLLLKDLVGVRIPWISGADWAPVSIMLLDIWQWLPFMFLGFLSALQSLPNEPFEAARVDGANSWQVFRFVTFPMLKPVAITLTFLRSAHAFQVFDFSFGLTGGGPGLVTETASLYIYRTAFKRFDLGFASAQSYIFFIIVIVIAMFFLRSLRKSWEGEVA